VSAVADPLGALREGLLRLGRVAVATSGGVDSTTLAVVAHRSLGARAEIFHAISPAVPAEATARVRHYAEREGWRLHCLDAGEFERDDYVRNPVDRCFYCKQSLYASIAPRTDATIVSGTNSDDLGDYRPGLDAARDRGVRHPYVEAGIDKATVRAIARWLGLDDLAELPAAPCLSSRVETGISIRPELLDVVHRVERELGGALSPDTVRCRLRRDGVVVELDGLTLERLSPGEREHWCARVSEIWREAGHAQPVRLEAYRMGSAFLRVIG
jgi:uncharacterized protein